MATVELQATNVPPISQALQILNRGPDYFRERILKNRGGLKSNRKSAVEILAASKCLYVKSSKLQEAQNQRSPGELDEMNIGDEQAKAWCYDNGVHSRLHHQEECQSTQKSTDRLPLASHSHGKQKRCLDTNFPNAASLQQFYGKLGNEATDVENNSASLDVKNIVWNKERNTNGNIIHLTDTLHPTNNTYKKLHLDGNFKCHNLETWHLTKNMAETDNKSNCLGMVEDLPCTGHCTSSNGLHKGCESHNHRGCQHRTIKSMDSNNKVIASPSRMRISGLVLRSDGHHSSNGDLGSDVAMPREVPLIMHTSSEWRDTRTDTSSELDLNSPGGSFVRLQDHSQPCSPSPGVVIRRRAKKGVLRSRSDIAKRFSNSSDISDLSARLSRNSADLEKFFNEMGLDRAILEPMLLNQCPNSSSDLHLFDSASSFDSSGDVQSGDNRGKVKSPPIALDSSSEGSIVERNARIIKWLCNVKKASSQDEEEDNCDSGKSNEDAIHPEENVVLQKTCDDS